MTATANPRLRLILLLGLLAAAALGAGLLLMSRSAASAEASDAPLPPLRRASAAPSLPSPAASPSKPKPAAQAQSKPKPAAAKPTPKPQPKPKPKPAAAQNGLPAALNAALGKHRVVVVSLVIPGASVDELARAEAQAGARDAGVGFVTVNLLDAKQGGLLAKKLGVLEAPAVLVYRRPDALVLQLDGFADRETVAQAATNARS